jgi:hypothetical protein
MAEYIGYEVFVRPGSVLIGQRVSNLEKQLKSDYKGKISIDHIHDDECSTPNIENRKPFHRKEIIKIGYRIKVISQDQREIDKFMQNYK